MNKKKTLKNVLIYFRDRQRKDFCLDYLGQFLYPIAELQIFVL